MRLRGEDRAGERVAVVLRGRKWQRRSSQMLELIRDRRSTDGTVVPLHVTAPYISTETTCSATDGDRARRNRSTVARTTPTNIIISNNTEKFLTERGFARLNRPLPPRPRQVRKPDRIRNG